MDLSKKVKLGRFLFKWRGILGVPFYAIALFFGRPGKIDLILGVIFAFLGLLIRFVSVAYTGRTTRSREIKAPKLVKEGPYGIVRNPIYVGNFFTGIGFLLLLSGHVAWLILAFLIAFSFEYYFIVKAEEDFLEKTFGEEFENYKKEVKAFWPNFRGFVKWKNSKVKGDFKSAFISEQNTWRLSMAVFLISIAKQLLLNFILSAK